jgi:hypothetical protein
MHFYCSIVIKFRPVIRQSSGYLLIVWSYSDTLNYNCILASKESSCRWLDYWPKQVGNNIVILYKSKGEKVKVKVAP